ncbi:unnamed protein product [Effrenium voratum]|nr:unnamed protein product [Effrenium voratum]
MWETCSWVHARHAQHGSPHVLKSPTASGRLAPCAAKLPACSLARGDKRRVTCIIQVRHRSCPSQRQHGDLITSSRESELSPGIGILHRPEVVPTMICQSLMAWAAKHAEASLMAMFPVLQPVASASLSWLLRLVVPSLRDTLVPPQWNMLGGVPVVAGLWLVSRAHGKRA